MPLNYRNKYENLIFRKNIEKNRICSDNNTPLVWPWCCGSHLYPDSWFLHALAIRCQCTLSTLSTCEIPKVFFSVSFNKCHKNCFLRYYAKKNAINHEYRCQENVEGLGRRDGSQFVLCHRTFLCYTTVVFQLL